MLSPEQVETWVATRSLANDAMTFPQVVRDVLLFMIEHGDEGIICDLQDFGHPEVQIGDAVCCSLWERIHRYFNIPWIIATTTTQSTTSRDSSACWFRQFWNGKDYGTIRQWAAEGKQLTGSPEVLENYRTRA